VIIHIRKTKFYETTMQARIDRDIERAKDLGMCDGVEWDLESGQVLLRIRKYDVKIIPSAEYPFKCPEVFISGVSDDIYPGDDSFIQCIEGCETGWSRVYVRNDWNPAMGFVQIIVDLDSALGWQKIRSDLC